MEAIACLWINIFMYRTTAMVNPDKHLLLNLEYLILPASPTPEYTTGGTIDQVQSLLVEKERISTILTYYFSNDICLPLYRSPSIPPKTTHNATTARVPSHPGQGSQYSDKLSATSGCCRDDSVGRDTKVYYPFLLYYSRSLPVFHFYQQTMPSRCVN